MVNNDILLARIIIRYSENNWDPTDKCISLDDLLSICNDLNNAPSPHWIMTRKSWSGVYLIRCSECKKLIREPTEFCPGCGEKMIGSNEYIYEEEKDI